MQKCKSCEGILLPGAKFCHKCGEKVEIETQESVVIKEESSQVTIDFEVFDARTTAVEDAKEIKIEKIEKVEIVEPTNIQETITANQNVEKKVTALDFMDYKALFFNALHARVVDEHTPKMYSDFVEKFYRKKFDATLQQRFELLQEELLQIEKKMPLPEKPKARYLKHTTENLIDLFIYTYCTDLPEVFPKQLILKYADAKPQQVKNVSFYQDFLQLQDENLQIYRDFISMPQEKLKNSFQSYLFTEREELVYFICDLSLTGSGKEGFAISNKRMYWRMPLGKPHSVSFDNIQAVKHTQEWLEINGLFFNVNKSLNRKMLRMFKKIKLIYEG